MTPLKPHLTYQQQLNRLVDRGLAYTDHDRAMAFLRGIGYYRLSAYTYPFREPGTAEDKANGRERSSKFRSGATLEDAIALYEFDEKVRAALLRGLQTIEVGVAVKVGYTLGKRDPMAHIDSAHLDPVRCAEVRRDGRTAFEQWEARYTKLQADAKSEDYVKHHVLHYGGSVPVWAATGFLDFGAVSRLYGLLQSRDQETIAKELGLTGHAGQVLYRWLVALNIVRNHCAHNNRVWNRSTVGVPPKIPAAVCPPELVHLNLLDNRGRQKLYLTAALVAHLTRQIDARSTWGWSTFKTVAKKFPSVPGMTLENTLGFPHGWAELPLWQNSR
jgi:abortive infection bacteriophage resistance protein